MVRSAGIGLGVIDLALGENVSGVRKGRYPAPVDQARVPSTVIGVKVGAEHEIDILRPGPGRGEPGQPGSFGAVVPGQAVLVDTDHALDDEVWLEPTPGHTPGHVAVGLASNGDHAVMCGDLMHSPIQCLFPEWRFRIDADYSLANDTRRRFLQANCDSGPIPIIPA